MDELATLLEAGEADKVQCVDVREEWEASTASIPSFKLLPLSRWVVHSLNTGDLAGYLVWSTTGMGWHAKR